MGTWCLSYFLCSFFNNDVPTPAPIATPALIHKPMLFVKIPTSVPKLIPMPIAVVNFLFHY
jgi:hypothetical protein